MCAARSIVSRFLNQQVRRYSAGYHGEHAFKPPSMDELPVPSGSWQAQHDANQRGYNAALLFGVAFTAFTIVMAKSTGLVYLNYSPPKTLD